MTTSATTSSGLDDRVPGGGSVEAGGRVDLAEDFLPISWSAHSTATLKQPRDGRNMGRSAAVFASVANTTAQETP
jgi:hypothetical protein